MGDKGEDLEKWFKEVQASAFKLASAPPAVAANREIVLEAVRQSGSMLQDAADPLKADKEVVLTAISIDGEALEFASRKMKADKEVVRAAVKNNWTAIKHADPKAIHNDSKMMLEFIKQKWYVAIYASTHLKADARFWHKVMKQQEDGWMAFCEYSPKSLRADEALMLQAMDKDPLAFKYAHDSLKADRNFVFAAISHNWVTLLNANEKFRGDKEIILEAMKQDIHAFELASNELKEDKEVLKLALRENGRVVQYLPMRNRTLRPHVIEALENNGMALPYVAPEFREDGEVVDAAMRSRLGFGCTGNRWRFYFTTAKEEREKEIQRQAELRDAEEKRQRAEEERQQKLREAMEAGEDGINYGSQPSPEDGLSAGPSMQDGAGTTTITVVSAPDSETQGAPARHRLGNLAPLDVTLKGSLESPTGTPRSAKLQSSSRLISNCLAFQHDYSPLGSARSGAESPRSPRSPRGKHSPRSPRGKHSPRSVSKRSRKKKQGAVSDGFVDWLPAPGSPDGPLSRTQLTLTWTNNELSKSIEDLVREHFRKPETVAAVEACD